MMLFQTCFLRLIFALPAAGIAIDHQPHASDTEREPRDVNKLITYIGRAFLLLVASEFLGVSRAALFPYQLFLLDESSRERSSWRSRELLMIICTVVVACCWRHQRR